MSSINNITLKNMAYNGEKVKKWIHNGVQVFSAGSNVTYYVDTNVTYTEEVDSGASCLSPTTFTPAKDGWTFIGWREDTIASGDVLSSKVMGDEPITLYAVYQTTAKCTFYSGENCANVQTSTGTAYYNSSGNLQDAILTCPTGADIGGWTWRGWSYVSETWATAGVNCPNGMQYGSHDEHVRYGLYEMPITVAYDGNGAESGYVSSQTISAYYNSAGNASYPSFTLAGNGYGKSGYTFTGWTNNGVDTYSAGQTITVYGSVTFYAVWTADTITVIDNYTDLTGTLAFTNEGSTVQTVDISGTTLAVPDWCTGEAQYRLAGSGFSVGVRKKVTFTVEMDCGDYGGWLTLDSELESGLYTVATPNSGTYTVDIGESSYFTFCFLVHGTSERNNTIKIKSLTLSP